MTEILRQINKKTHKGERLKGKVRRVPKGQRSELRMDVNSLEAAFIMHNDTLITVRIHLSTHSHIITCLQVLLLCWLQRGAKPPVMSSESTQVLNQGVFTGPL